MTVVEPRRPSVSAAQSIPTYYRMLLRGQLPKGRMVGLGVLGGISLLLAVVTRTSAEQVDLEEVSVALLSAYSISLLIPLAALILASPMIGNLVEDRLLVYLWLKPVPRWHLAVAAYAAVVTTLAPVVVLPVVATAAITGFGSLIVPATAAAILGVPVYGLGCCTWCCGRTWCLASVAAWPDCRYVVICRPCSSGAPTCRSTSPIGRVGRRSSSHLLLRLLR